MNGDYANNVAITLNPDGSLAYFRIPPTYRQIHLPGNRQWLVVKPTGNIGKVSKFTKYTFAEYSKLKTVPSIAELKASVIPRITCFKHA